MCHSMTYCVSSVIDVYTRKIWTIQSRILRRIIVSCIVSRDCCVVHCLVCIYIQNRFINEKEAKNRNLQNAVLIRNSILCDFNRLSHFMRFLWMLLKMKWISIRNRRTSKRIFIIYFAIIWPTKKNHFQEISSNDELLDVLDVYDVWYIYSESSSSYSSLYDVLFLV